MDDKRKNKFKKDKYGHINGETDNKNKNLLDALRDMKDVEEEKEVSLTKEQE